MQGRLGRYLPAWVRRIQNDTDYKALSRAVLLKWVVIIVSIW